MTILLQIKEKKTRFVRETFVVKLLQFNVAKH